MGEKERENEREIERRWIMKIVNRISSIVYFMFLYRSETKRKQGKNEREITKERDTLDHEDSAPYLLHPSFYSVYTDQSQKERRGKIYRKGEDKEREITKERDTLDHEDSEPYLLHPSFHFVYTESESERKQGEKEER